MTLHEHGERAAAGADPDAPPGRSCPLRYRYAPEVFRREPEPGLAGLEALWVVGGLYGHEGALDALDRLLAADRARTAGAVAVVFNGDFHWFDAEPGRGGVEGAFSRVQRRVLAGGPAAVPGVARHVLAGNVEAEIGAWQPGDEAAAGCGCAYPDWVGDAVVERSNRIHARLAAAATPAERAALAALPLHAVAEVGGRRIALVHGDAESLAGWGFAQEHLRDPAQRERVRGWFARAGVDAFACSHTCLPVFQRLATTDGERWVFNNGAAGMPNARGDLAGLATRIATAPFAGPGRRFGVAWRGVHAEAIALESDPEADQARFLALWPPGSDAHASYFERITRGPEAGFDEALRLDG